MVKILMKNKIEIYQVIYYALYLNDIFYLLCLIEKEYISESDCN